MLARTPLNSYGQPGAQGIKSCIQLSSATSTRISNNEDLVLIVLAIPSTTALNCHKHHLQVQPTALWRRNTLDAGAPTLIQLSGNKRCAFHCHSYSAYGAHKPWGSLPKLPCKPFVIVVVDTPHGLTSVWAYLRIIINNLQYCTQHDAETASLQTNAFWNTTRPVGQRTTHEIKSKRARNCPPPVLGSQVSFSYANSRRGSTGAFFTPPCERFARFGLMDRTRPHTGVEIWSRWFTGSLQVSLKRNGAW